MICDEIEVNCMFESNNFRIFFSLLFIVCCLFYRVFLSRCFIVSWILKFEQQFDIVSIHGEMRETLGLDKIVKVEGTKSHYLKQTFYTYNVLYMVFSNQFSADVLKQWFFFSFSPIAGMHLEWANQKIVHLDQEQKVYGMTLTFFVNHPTFMCSISFFQLFYCFQLSFYWKWFC